VARRRPNRSKPARAGVLALGVGLALAIGGCATVPPRQPISPEAAAARALLERRWEEFRDLRSLVQITLRRGDRVQRLAGVLLLSAPSALRFEALSTFGTPVLVVGEDATTLTLWEVVAERAYLLPASPDSTRRWLGLALGPDELVATLSGHALPLRDPFAVELMPADGLGPSLTLRNADVVQQIWFDPADGRPRAVEWRGGSNAARAVFTDGLANAAPARVTLATLDGKLEASVRYQDPRVNSGLDAELVRVTVPEHVTIQDRR
jgi:outer membrane lipoprotein-sorting protein